jgi:hypothetical protein
MIKFIKQIIRNSGLFGLYKQIINFKTLAFGYNQLKSLKESKCVDIQGNKTPWYTYPAIEYLNNIDFSNKSIFEFGCGYSTLYWGDKANYVFSVESDENWFNDVSEKVGDNCCLALKEKDSGYENTIKELDAYFDVVVIDGYRRLECAKIIVDIYSKIEDEYMIILDNSEWCKETAQYLKDKLDVIQVDFYGFGHSNAYNWVTSIFYSRDFNFKSIETQPTNPIGYYKNIGGIR